MSEQLVGTRSAANAIERVSYTHDAMIDLMIANPAIRNAELATHFRFTQTWISRVVNSDAFLARLAARKEDIIDPSIVVSLEEKFKALADASLDIFMDKLHATNSADMALKGIEAASKALGYGARANQTAPTVNNFVVALPGKIADADEWAKTHGPEGNIIDQAPEAIE
jgi:hypothetical protein